MKKQITLLALSSILFINFSQAQEKAFVRGKADVFLSFPGGDYIAEKFDFGVGATLGASIFLPNAKTYITPHAGFDFMAARAVGSDDTYRESIFFTTLGIEFMYELVSGDDFKLLPFATVSTRKVIDRYLRASGDIVFNSNGGSDLDYDKLPPLFSQSAISLNLGLENRFNDRWFIRISYELFQPEVTANLSNSYDSIDNQTFNPATQQLNLSTVKIGAGAFF